MPQNICSAKQTAMEFLHCCIVTKDIDNILQFVTDDIYWLNPLQKQTKGKSAFKALLEMPQITNLPKGSIVYHNIEENIHSSELASVCAEFTVLWKSDGISKHSLFVCTIILKKIQNDWKITLTNCFPLNSSKSEYEALPIGLCYIQPEENMKIIYANPHFYKLLGFTEAQSKTMMLDTLKSFVHPRDFEQVSTSLKSIAYFNQQDTSLEFRIKSKTSDPVWLLAKCSCDINSTLTLVLIDITLRHKQEKAAHMRAEEFRLALQQHTEKLIARYDLVEKTLNQSEYLAKKMNQPAILYNVPESILSGGFISDESKAEYKAFFDSIQNAEPNGHCNLYTKNKDGSHSWYHADYSLIYNEDHEPTKAIISFEDITKYKENEQSYKKWQRYNESQLPNCLAYYECNLTLDRIDRIDGPLAVCLTMEARKTYTSTAEFVAQYFVHPEYLQRYKQFFDRKRLLSQYNQGVHSANFEHRRIAQDGRTIWAKASIQLLPDPYSNDIKGFVLINDIENQKQSNSSAKLQMRIDNLTGALNRESFLAEFSALLSSSAKAQSHAIIAIDIDRFNKLNNYYGYLAGDAILKDIVESITDKLPKNSFIGRMSGDDFMACLPNLSSRDELEKTLVMLQDCLALQAELEKKSVSISVSMGVVVYPYDGISFPTLNHKAGIAIKQAKKLGGSNIVAYSQNTDTALQINTINTVKNIPEIQDVKYGYEIAMRFAYDALFVCNLNANVYNTVFNSLPGVAAHINNGSLMRILRLLGKKIIFADDLDLFNQCFSIHHWEETILAGFSHRTVEIRALTPNNQYSWYRLVLVSQISVEGELSLYCFVTDINQNKNAELLKQELQEEASRYRIIFEQTGTIVLEYNHEFNSFYASPHANEFTFYENIQTNNHSFFSAKDVYIDDLPNAEIFLASLENGLESDTTTIRLKKTNNNYIWCRLAVTTIKNSLGEISRTILTIDDVDEATKDRNSLKYRAEYDSLTGYINFEYFKAEVKKLLQKRNNRHYAVWYCDIKNFKFVNDIYGYDTGDLVLQKWAKILVDDNREFESCARISSDQFCAFRIYETHEEMVSRLQKATDTLWNFEELFDKRFRLELVTGIYCIENNEDLVSIEDMLDRANIAQKSVKNVAGSRYAFYSKSMRDHIIHEKAIEADMPLALANNEFCFYLQPQVDIQDGNTIMGAEALVRWKKPDGSIVPPNAFIPLFEKNGFIVELDLYVFQEVCRYISSRMREGLDLFKISVNASRISVFQRDFINKYIDIKNSYKIPDNILQLECTETTVVENLKMLDEIIKTMHSNGFLFALDDFGAGYSSLNMLKDVTADELKLDMGFVHSGLHNMKETAIVSSVISMAQKIGMKTVAEGVETREQLHALQALNCNIVQGYLFGKPLPIEDFEHLYDATPHHETFIE